MFFIAHLKKPIECINNLSMYPFDCKSFHFVTCKNLPKTEKTSKTIVHGFVNFVKK